MIAKGTRTTAAPTAIESPPASCTGDDQGPRLLLPEPLARPLRAAAHARRPQTAVRNLLARFGFTSASYFLTRERDGVLGGELLWTTLPSHWIAHYKRDALLAIDPRLVRARRSIGPTLWDAASLPGDWRTQRFLRCAAALGIGSGVVVTLHDGVADRVTVTFDSPLTPMPPARRAVIESNLGDITLFAIGLHESVLKWRIERPARRTQALAMLTLRERNCLELAARGLTSADIGSKLSVAERTVNFHFSNIKVKLGAMNRPEAIARGIAMGIVASD